MRAGHLDKKKFYDYFRIIIQGIPFFGLGVACSGLLFGLLLATGASTAFYLTAFFIGIAFTIISYNFISTPKKMWFVYPICISTPVFLMLFLGNFSSLGNPRFALKLLAIMIFALPVIGAFIGKNYLAPKDNHE